MKASTIKVREALESGALTERDLGNWIHESHALKGETLTASELANEVTIVKKAIMNGDARIPGFSWHHHQETWSLDPKSGESIIDNLLVRVPIKK